MISAESSAHVRLDMDGSESSSKILKIAQNWTFGTRRVGAVAVSRNVRSREPLFDTGRGTEAPAPIGGYLTSQVMLVK